jgi:hypothetical protein
MSVPRRRGWYWKVHGDKYTRASVADIEEFVGWPTLMALVKECENTPYKPNPLNPADPEEYRSHLVRRDQALIAALFLTGGRVNEVVPLRRLGFEVTPESINVRGMQVLKRFKAVDVHTGPDGRKTYTTEPVHVTRGVIPIEPTEPLVPYLMKWVEKSSDYLFPSPAEHRNHISGTRAYQIVTDVGERIGEEIWPHWFRSQRASQLVVDYGFNIHELADWFKWVDMETARQYAKLDPSVFIRIYKKGLKKRSEQETIAELRERVDVLQRENMMLREAQEGQTQ